MKQQILVFLLMVFLCQVFSYSKELTPRENNDSSVVKIQQLRADTLAKAIQNLNERIDVQIEKQRTTQNIALFISICAAIAAIGSAIATFKNLRISRLQKRIALFEKRFQIYDIIGRTMIGAMPNGNKLVNGLGFPTYIDFLRGTTDKDLFFKKDTCDEIDQIQDVLKKMYNNAISLEDENDNVKREELLEEQKKHSKVIKEWIDGEPPKLMILFKDYLEFKDP
jgi:hypothetical protein